MITFKEIIKGTPLNDIPISVQHNIEDLLVRLNKIRAAWGKPMIVTSGYRTDQDQRRINPRNPRSNHLAGKACDIWDPTGELKAWLIVNVELLKEAGLWCEDFSVTPRWVHFQSVPPKSGNRFFLP